MTKEKDIFRANKGLLTPEQKSRVDFIKAEAKKFKAAIQSSYDNNEKLNTDQRCVDIALVKLEECVMWAVKGFTDTEINN